MLSPAACRFFKAQTQLLSHFCRFHMLCCFTLCLTASIVTPALNEDCLATFCFLGKESLLLVYHHWIKTVICCLCMEIISSLGNNQPLITPNVYYFLNICKIYSAHLCGFQSSSQISKPMQVSLVEITPSPNGTTVCPVYAEIMRGK